MVVVVPVAVVAAVRPMPAAGEPEVVAAAVVVVDVEAAADTVGGAAAADSLGADTCPAASVAPGIEVDTWVARASVEADTWAADIVVDSLRAWAVEAAAEVQAVFSLGAVPVSAWVSYWLCAVRSVL